MQGFNFHTASAIRVAPGASLRLAEDCQRLGLTRPLLVTDAGLVALGLIAPVVDSMADAGVQTSVFDAVTADPPESVVLSALEKLNQSDCDGVIAVGGGSSMDVAKVVAVLARGRQALSELYGVDQVQGERLPLILVPTTAGTGSEVTPVAVITTGETTKAGVSSPKLLPDVAVLDAELTAGLPASITAMTGIDAMVHAIEAFTSKHKKNPISDMLAQRALRLLAGNIRRVLADGNDMPAREAMLLGSMFAGQAFANAPVAAVHALAYPLGGHYHIPHGLSNSLMLPTVLHFNSTAVAGQYAALCNELPGNVSPSANDFISWFETLISDSGLPATLREAGVAEDMLPTLASDAMLQQRLLVNNPVPLSESDALNLYRRAWG